MVGMKSEEKNPPEHKYSVTFVTKVGKTISKIRGKMCAAIALAGGIVRKMNAAIALAGGAALVDFNVPLFIFTAIDYYFESLRRGKKLTIQERG